MCLSPHLEDPSASNTGEPGLGQFTLATRHVSVLPLALCHRGVHATRVNSAPVQGPALAAGACPATRLRDRRTALHARRERARAASAGDDGTLPPIGPHCRANLNPDGHDSWTPARIFSELDPARLAKGRVLRPRPDARRRRPAVWRLREALWDGRIAAYEAGWVVIDAWTGSVAVVGPTLAAPAAPRGRTHRGPASPSSPRPRSTTRSCGRAGWTSKMAVRGLGANELRWMVKRTRRSTTGRWRRTAACSRSMRGDRDAGVANRGRLMVDPPDASRGRLAA